MSGRIYTQEAEKPKQIVDLHNHNMVEEQAKKLYNEKLENLAADLDLDIKKRISEGELMEEKMSAMEIMPIGSYILISPFAKNPYQVLKMKGNIIVGGYNGNFVNPDTGEEDQEEQMMIVGSVIEVGPECKYIKEGDDVFYTKTSLVPIPFFGKGLQLVNENRIAVVINKDLKKRFGMIKSDTPDVAEQR